MRGGVNGDVDSNNRPLSEKELRSLISMVSKLTKTIYRDVNTTHSLTGKLMEYEATIKLLDYIDTFPSLIRQHLKEYKELNKTGE